MDREKILEAIDEEIATLQHVKLLLSSNNGSNLLNVSGRGTEAKVPKKRILSDDARSRIAQAQKRRWAKQRKETASAKKS
jgi:hypothetical protein